MTRTLPVDLTPIFALTESQKWDVVEAIEASIAEPKVVVSEAFMAELLRRRDHARAYPEENVPLEVCIAELETRFPVLLENAE